MTEIFLSNWIQENKNDVLRKDINYLPNDMASKILLMQQFIMISKTLTCIEVLCICVMENCKKKMCLIVKNCYSYKINSQSVEKNSILIRSLMSLDMTVKIIRQ